MEITIDLEYSDGMPNSGETIESNITGSSHTKVRNKAKELIEKELNFCINSPEIEKATIVIQK